MRSVGVLAAAAMLCAATACGNESIEPSASEPVSPVATTTALATTTTLLTSPAPTTSSAPSSTLTRPTSTTTSPVPSTTIPSTTTTSTNATSTTTTSTTTSTTTTTTVAPFAGTTTACRAVALIGDSVSVGLDGANGVLSADETINARLADIGVVDVRLEVSGGRSIVETLANQTNGVDAIDAIQATGFDGCWVVALGTNDAANIAAESNAGAQTRVARVLDAVAGEPVLWLTASTVRTDGYWARTNMERWNDELTSLTSEVATVAVADWDSLASGQPWFVSDGIHPNTAGLNARSQYIADTLRVFYPG